MTEAVLVGGPVGLPTFLTAVVSFGAVVAVLVVIPRDFERSAVSAMRIPALENRILNVLSVMPT